MRRALLAVVLLGCTSSPEPGARLAADPAPAVEAEATGDDAPVEPGQTFGDPIDEAVPETTLSEILSAPDQYRDQVIRAEGEIARVCQRAGCWMELREGDGEAVRVPMAGHAFFLPRDSAGRRASIQGRVTIRELSQDVREHLESEGAVATASALSIHATGVTIAPES